MKLYTLISGWRTFNDYNLVEAECFKILTCDPKDDVVENYASLPVGVASRLSKKQYKEEKWDIFYKCLCMMYDVEEHIYNKLD